MQKQIQDFGVLESKENRSWTRNNGVLRDWTYVLLAPVIHTIGDES
jgi:hypothetical protein